MNFLRARAIAVVASLAAVASLGGAAQLQPSTASDAAPGGSYLCVGSPPRQTADPLSPPCTAFWDGVSGGATAPGVTADEVRLVVYLDGGYRSLSKDGPIEDVPANRTYDLGRPPDIDSPEPSAVGILRTYQRYFNARYQTYGRRAHLFVHFNDSAGARSNESSRADAAHLVHALDPFAIIDAAGSAAHGTFAQTVARRGRLVFGDHAASRAARARTFPGLIWNHQPSDEQQAQLFGAYVCESILASPAPSGSARRLGLLSSTASPEFVSLAAAVRSQVGGCGGSFLAEAASPTHGFAFQASEPLRAEALEAMTEFKILDIDTVIWAGGLDPSYTRAASAIGYRPQWVTTGDGLTEGQNASAYHGPLTWDGAISVATSHTPVSPTSDHCGTAVREVSTSTPGSDIARWCQLYPPLRQVFTAIQLAGPQLTAANVDAGLHAIPASSPGPTVAACWYEAGDYTCGKDVAIGRWDATAPPASVTPGCWRLHGGGLRYRQGSFPPVGDLPQGPRTDTCSTYSAPASIILSPV